MVRILGVNIPDNKKVHIALTYIYGIGHTSGKKICEELSIDNSLRVHSLSEEEILSIRDHIAKNYMVEGELKTSVLSNIRALVDIGTFRGMRHVRGLPLRGQRTRSNAHTAKKKLNMRKTNGS